MSQNCPYCGAEVIEGADICDDCQHSLTHLSIPVPSTKVEEGLANDRLTALSPKPPLTVAPEESVGEVLKKMVDESIGCVMIVDRDEMVGIFSERDALMRINTDVGKLADEPISTIMTPSPATLKETAKIAYALHQMDVGGYRHIPILSEDEILTGVISIRDILGYLTARGAAGP